ncbi:hypothetical protein SCUCBS95973_002294 [Sporothrix curviconia]|uniref:Zn(2)-C6 fungal-type domain-containing protein n=1 Tax=Sporothrix curviconia TaxID=1260050 RepID=A0ABP0B5T9_9PEZI
MPLQIDAGAESGDSVRRSLRKQTRLMSKTCETCKAKKSRCDSARPQCDTCRRKGVACIYKERGQPGLRPGYGRAVEGRLSLLEENMAKMAASMQDVLRHVQGRSHDALQQQQQQPPEGALQHSLEPLDALHHTPTQGLPVPPVPVQSYSTLPPALPMISAVNPGNPASPDIIDPTLPPRPVMDELVDLFFEHVYAWAPLFHRPTFQAAGMYASPDRRLLLHGMVVLGFRFWTKPAPPAAERAHYVKTSKDTLLVETVNAASLVAFQALALLAVDAMGDGPGPRTWNMMAMLVACARQLHLDHNPSPGVAGAASQHGPINGDGRAASPSSPLVTNDETGNDGSGGGGGGGDGGSALVEAPSAVEAEEKRRLFWTIYCLDRFSSVSLGQPSAIDGRRIRLQYPASDADWGHSAPLAWFKGVSPLSSFSPLSTSSPFPSASPPSLWTAFVDILALVDQSNQLLVQPTNLSLPAPCHEWQSKFRRIDILSRTWRENLPPAVRDPPAVFTPMWHLVHATFFLVHIRMYTVAAFPASPASSSSATSYLKPSPAALIHLRDCVEAMASLATGLTATQIGRLGPLFAFVVWVAARSAIILWTTGHTADPRLPPADLTTLLAALNQAAVYWPCAECYAEILQLILDTKNNPGGPTGITIFNDTRRTAYGLRSRLGSLARHRFALATRDRDLLFPSASMYLPFSAAAAATDTSTATIATDNFFDGVFAGLVDLPPAVASPAGMSMAMGGSAAAGFGFVDPSPDFERDWL